MLISCYLGHAYATTEGETIMVKRTIVGTMSSSGLTDSMFTRPLCFTALK
jgi:hypothetical protein